MSGLVAIVLLAGCWWSPADIPCAADEDCPYDLACDTAPGGDGMGNCAGGGASDDDDAVDDDDTVDDDDITDDDDAANDDDVADDDDTADDDDFGPDDKEVAVETADGLELHGTWSSVPEGSGRAGVLLLHDLGSDRSDFDSLVAQLSGAGFSTLALDFRSHGSSDQAPVSFGELATDPSQLPFDAEAGVAWIREQGEIDPDRVGVLGLGIGASVAVVANVGRTAWGVAATASVSAEADEVMALASVASLSDLNLAGAIYVAAEDHPSSSATATSLYETSVEPRELRLVLGTDAVGRVLLESSSDVRGGLQLWFGDELQ